MSKRLERKVGCVSPEEYDWKDPDIGFGGIDPTELLINPLSVQSDTGHNAVLPPGFGIYDAGKVLGLALYAQELEDRLSGLGVRGAASPSPEQD